MPVPAATSLHGAPWTAPRTRPRSSPRFSDPDLGEPWRGPQCQGAGCPTRLPPPDSSPGVPGPLSTAPRIPRCSELASPRAPTSPRPPRAPDPLLGEPGSQGAEDPRPPPAQLAGTLLLHKLRSDPSLQLRSDPRPSAPLPRAAPARPAPGAPLTSCPPPARSSLRRGESAPAELSRLPGRRAAHAPAVPPPPPQQLSRLRGAPGPAPGRRPLLGARGAGAGSGWGSGSRTGRRPHAPPRARPPATGRPEPPARPPARSPAPRPPQPPPPRSCSPALRSPPPPPLCPLHSLPLAARPLLPPLPARGAPRSRPAPAAPFSLSLPPFFLSQSRFLPALALAPAVCLCVSSLSRPPLSSLLPPFSLFAPLLPPSCLLSPYRSPPAFFPFCSFPFFLPPPAPHRRLPSPATLTCLLPGRSPALGPAQLL